MVKTTHQSPSDATPGPSSLSKRKREREEDMDNAQSKKSRNRVSFSCGECHRRKQKCDRQVPCGHCVARKVPELCKAYTPCKTDQDIGVRLSRLEHIIEMALPHLYSSGTLGSSAAIGDHRRSASASLDDDIQSQHEEQGPSGGTFQSGKWYGNSASGSLATASVLEELANVVPNSSVGDSSHRNSAWPKTPNESLHIVDSIGQDGEPSAAEKMKSLVQDCGVSPHKLSELLQELPPQRFSDVLIDYYFSQINWTRYPVSERDFRASYSSICANGISANLNDVRFLPLLFVVLSIAARLAPEHIAGDARTRRITSLRYYWSSRRSVLIAAAIQPDCLEMVLTRLLSARFLNFDRRITECWSQLGAAVRTAQALGLHRDATPMGMDPAQVEYRRRIWSHLYHADRTYALVLGRPNAIQDDYTSTLPPLNIDDELATSQFRTPPQLSSPTPMTFVILRHSLASIIGRIVHHFQQVRTTSHYSDVLTLDDDLLRFLNNLPPYFRLEPDTSLDNSMKFIPVHRFLLLTELFAIRISLHRPYLLRRLGSDRYTRSRTASFESAIRDSQVREAFREVMPKEMHYLSSAYREFQTAMISGIYLVLHPKGQDADMMHNIIDGFLKDHAGVREMDETTRREVKTIEFLKNKASEMKSTRDGLTQNQGTVATLESNESGHPIDAQLLLGLQQSNSRPSGALRSAHLYPSLVVGNSPAQTTSSANTPPSLPYAPIVVQSPRIQRLQNDAQAYENSHAGSDSPNADDESAAQSLLDYWCNTVSSTDGFAGATGLSWGGTSNDYSGFGNPNPPLPEAEPTTLMNGHNGSDWTFWETLVNQIRAEPIA